MGVSTIWKCPPAHGTTSIFSTYLLFPQYGVQALAGVDSTGSAAGVSWHRGKRGSNPSKPV
ncbi:hypothetical protein APASM_3845 [Actinosynnema pretiosum subsp. pretiosum]|nr:hypothetical protein APASM_3845 [Actinosynnema pretiosum subsp. pretiosum]